MFFGFFGYLRFMVGANAPGRFHRSVPGPEGAASRACSQTSAEVLLLGMGAWALWACFAPRVAILALPWIWGVCNGRWAMRMLGTDEWHMRALRRADGVHRPGRGVGRLRSRLADWLHCRGAAAGPGVLWSGSARPSFER